VIEKKERNLSNKISGIVHDYWVEHDSTIENTNKIFRKSFLCIIFTSIFGMGAMFYLDAINMFEKKVVIGNVNEVGVNRELLISYFNGTYKSVSKYINRDDYFEVVEKIGLEGVKYKTSQILSGDIVYQNLQLIDRNSTLNVKFVISNGRIIYISVH